MTTPGTTSGTTSVRTTTRVPASLPGTKLPHKKERGLARLPGETADARHEQIEIDRAAFFRTPGDVLLFRQYAAGQHRRILTAQQEVLLENILDNRFCDNVCHQIVAEAADRIQLLRWDCADASAQAFLTTFYVEGRLADLSGETHYNALRDGNYALALGWDNDSQRVTVQREPWWDGNTGTFIGYDAQGEPLYAVKEWNTLFGRRRAVWLEDRLERYMHDGGGWVPYALPSDGGEWPQVWAKPDGSPLHLPILHFPSAGRGTGIYGVSELDGGVLGFQDQINDLHYDMTAAGRLTGFQMIVLTGVQAPKDKTGKPDPAFQPQVGPGQVFTIADPAGSGSAIPAGDIGQLIALYNTKLRAVSRMTRTPLHAITGGDWPSGEALLRAEMPAVNKAVRQSARFLNAWATVAHRATEIANAFGAAGLDEDALITPVFSPPDRRDPLSKSAVIKNIDDKISIREALRIMGYSPDQAENIYQEMQEEKDDLGGTLLSRFDKGQGGGVAEGAGMAEAGAVADDIARGGPQDTGKGATDK